MDTRFKKRILVWTAVLLAWPVLAYGDDPIKVLQGHINNGIRVLTDEAYQDPGRKDAQYQELIKVFKESFDFSEFSRLVLGANAGNFTPEQKEEFVSVFSEFLTKFYMRQLQERYNGETVAYVKQNLITESKAQVSVEVFWRDLEVPVQVRMILRDGVWKVYDVVFLGISGMKNYRSQFDGILRNNSPDQVIGMLKDRLKGLVQAPHASRRTNPSITLTAASGRLYRSVSSE